MPLPDARPAPTSWVAPAVAPPAPGRRASCSPRHG
jgi:hypothetical protein